MTRLYGLMVVRDAADLIATNVRYHLAQGIEAFLIVDNGSTDATPTILDELAAEGRVAWQSFPGPFRQGSITSALAHEAFLRGADWVIPIDVDEFLYPLNGSLADALAASVSDALYVPVVNFVQRRGQVECSPASLLHMTWRVPEPVGPIERAIELIQRGKIGFVEAAYVPKVISRASPTLEIGVGNHSLKNASQPSQASEHLVILHAPMRSYSELLTRPGQARRYREAGNFAAWHVFHWEKVAEEGNLAAEWRSNSCQDASLDVHGERHPLVEDTRLRDTLEPFVGVLARPPGLAALDSAPEPLALDPAVFAPAGGWARSVLATMVTIDGWLDQPEACALMEFAVLAAARDGNAPIVEIGSYCGRSTVVLAAAASRVDDTALVYSIDPHEGELTETDQTVRQVEPTFARFQANVANAGFSDTVRAIRHRSYEVDWQQPIGLLYIDGLHDYLNVARDFCHFERWLKPEGFAAFDDYAASEFPGVVAFVDGLLAHGHYALERRVGRLIVLRKARTSDEATPLALADASSSGTAADTPLRPLEDDMDNLLSQEGTAGEKRRSAPVGRSGGPADQTTGVSTSEEARYLRERLQRVERAVAALRDLMSYQAVQLEQAMAEQRGANAEREATLAACDELLAASSQQLAINSQKARECERALADRELALVRQTARIADLETQLRSIQLSKVWPLVRLSGAVRRTLDSRRAGDRKRSPD